MVDLFLKQVSELLSLSCLLLFLSVVFHCLMQGVLSLPLEAFGHLQGQPPVDGTIHINAWKLIAKKCKQHMDLMKDMSNCNSMLYML